MKSLIKSAVALSLLTFATAPFAQDDAEDEGGFFSGVADFFGFGSDDDDGPVSGGGSSVEWYAGGQYGATKYEEDELRVADGFGYYGGVSLSNRFGAEVGFFDFGAAEVKGSPGAEVETDGLRGMITVATEFGDAPVRFGVGYYSLDTGSGGATESASGFSAGVRFEQGVTNNLFLTLGTDLFFNIEPDGSTSGSDAVVFSLGLSFHTSPPPPAIAEEGEGGVEVTPVEGYGDYGDYGAYGDYDYGGDSGGDASGDTGSGGGSDDGAPSADDYGDYDYDDGSDDGSDDGGDGAAEEPAGEDDYEDAYPE